MNNSEFFKKGMKDGIPIALAYFAVSFTLGIAMKNAGMNAIQGFFMSLLNNASAGEYAGISMIAIHASYIEIMLMTFIANARYLLMSFALSQKFHPQEKLFHRLLVGFDLTDELFGLAINQKGYLNPFYYYGGSAITIPCWATGTALGIILGNVLPTPIVQALSVALFGMFLAIIIPEAKKEKPVLLVILCAFTLSYLCSILPGIRTLSEGTRTIILTVVLASLAAFFFPRKEAQQ